MVVISKRSNGRGSKPLHSFIILQNCKSFAGSNPAATTGSTVITSIPERSKGVDLRSTAYASWVRIPLLVLGSTVKGSLNSRN